MALLATKAITSKGEPFTARDHVKMFVASLSYANLCFLNVWAEVQDRANEFMNKYALTWQKVVALSLDILIVAVVVWGILFLALSSGKPRSIRIVKWLAMLGLLIPLNILRTDGDFISVRDAYIPHSLVVQFSVAVVLGVVLIYYWERFSARVATTLLIALAPAMPIAVANAGWHVWKGPPGAVLTNKSLGSALPQPAGAPHLIWVIFDEWDQALTFRDRPAGLSLPEIDRFQSETFHANRVYTPSRDTIISVPSLLTGKIFIDSKLRGPGELMLTYDRSQPPVSLTGQSTIFSEARRRGLNFGIAGWYLPYCRLIPECTVCDWSVAFPFVGLSEIEARSVSGSMAYFFAEQFQKVPVAHHLEARDQLTIHKGLHVSAYWQIREAMLRTITDPRLNLVFVHMSIPHPPAIYLADGDTMSVGPDTTYVDNLRLVDKTIRDLRHALEESGAWDTSTILLAADHPVRLATWAKYNEALSRQPVKQHAEVPFLLKLPGQKLGFSYDKPMQEIVTKDLLLAILNREVTTPDQVAAWLDRNRPHL